MVEMSPSNLAGRLNRNPRNVKWKIDQGVALGSQIDFGRTTRLGKLESPSRSQARGQPRRQISGEDAILRGFQVIGCAVEVDYLGVRVE